MGFIDCTPHCALLGLLDQAGWARSTKEGHKNAYKYLVGNYDGRVHLTGVNVNRRIILKR